MPDVLFLLLVLLVQGVCLTYCIREIRRVQRRADEVFAVVMRSPPQAKAEAAVIAEWQAAYAAAEPGSPKHEAYGNRLRSLGAL